jgi:N-carbamoylputrescine amidase
MDVNAQSSNPRRLRVAAVQMVSENGCVTENLAHAIPMIDQAGKEGAQLILLPEFMATGYYLGEDIWKAAEPAEGPTVTWLRDNSRRLGLWLGASFLEADGEDFFNTFVLTDPQGKISGRVRKQTPAIWEAYFFKGESGSHVIHTPFGKVGVGICFDVHTTVVAAIMSRQAVDLVLMPHSYPIPAGSGSMFERDAMMHRLEMLASLYVSLLGVPVVLANKCGLWVSPIPGPQLAKLAGSRFPGLSIIIDSDGSVKARLGDQEKVIVADVSLDPTRKNQPVPPHYGRYVYPGPRRRAILRLVESMGRLRYALSSTRRSLARLISQSATG